MKIVNFANRNRLHVLRLPGLKHLPPYSGVSDVGYIYVIYFWKPDISESDTKNNTSFFFFQWLAHGIFTLFKKVHIGAVEPT
ncbi:hypothetical protein D5071_11275 [Pectobacterium carotovorum]|uniref:Uncharacterized protein n=1 Tax=Pectobacterium carotovorum TaxID=554 RepID=A0A419AVW8_PECCA|nr:hypothetical protein D5071_11275 [Pectobacterium carotovorum]